MYHSRFGERCEFLFSCSQGLLTQPKQRVQRVFTNHVINRMKKHVSTTTVTPSESKQSSHCSCGGSRDFVTLSTRMSGRQLFERENRELITAMASKLVAEKTSTSIVGSYQQTLKQMWDSEATDRAEYDQRAKVLSSDVSKYVPFKLLDVTGSLIVIAGTRQSSLVKHGQRCRAYAKVESSEMLRCSSCMRFAVRKVTLSPECEYLSTFHCKDELT